MAERLQQLGQTVVQASTGEEAVETALAAMKLGAVFHAIVLQMHLAGTDGYEVVRQLAAAGYPGPVVALTQVQGEQEFCLQAGCCDHLITPVRKEILEKLVVRYVVQDTTFSGTSDSSAGTASLPNFSLQMSISGETSVTGTLSEEQMLDTVSGTGTLFRRSPAAFSPQTLSLSKGPKVPWHDHFLAQLPKMRVLEQEFEDVYTEHEPQH